MPVDLNIIADASSCLFLTITVDWLLAFCSSPSVCGLHRIISIICLQMNDIVDASQSSTLELQEQIDLYKEKNRRELTELQKLLKERGQELEKHLLTSKTLQEEVPRSPSAPLNIITTYLTAETGGGARPTPPLVTPGLPCTQLMMSFCSNVPSLPSLHHPLLFQECHRLGIFLIPNCPALLK